MTTPVYSSYAPAWPQIQENNYLSELYTAHKDSLDEYDIATPLLSLQRGANRPKKEVITLLDQLISIAYEHQPEALLLARGSCSDLYDAFNAIACRELPYPAALYQLATSGLTPPLEEGLLCEVSSLSFENAVEYCTHRNRLEFRRPLSHHNLVPLLRQIFNSVPPDAPFSLAARPLLREKLLDQILPLLYRQEREGGKEAFLAKQFSLRILQAFVKEANQGLNYRSYKS